jgi:hypothetical protein
MHIIDNDTLFRQFGAAIDMLGNALRDCPRVRSNHPREEMQHG